MNCSAPIPGPRGDRNWMDDSRATPPDRPPQLRTVALIVAAYFLVAAALAIGGAFLQQWWRSS